MVFVGDERITFKQFFALITMFGFEPPEETLAGFEYLYPTTPFPSKEFLDELGVDKVGFGQMLNINSGYADYQYSNHSDWLLNRVEQGYYNKNLLVPLYSLDEKNLIKTKINSYLKSVEPSEISKMVIKHKKLLDFRVPSYDYFCKNLVGNVHKGFVELIETAMLKPVYERETFIEPKERFFNLENSYLMYGNEIKLEFDFQFRTDYKKDTNGNISICYEIEKAKMKNHSKELLNNYLTKIGFPFEATQKDYLIYLSHCYPKTFFHKKTKRSTGKTETFDFNVSMIDIFKLLIPSKIKPKWFINHTHIVGRSGSGKSEFLKNIIKQLEKNCILIDPHGDIAESFDKKQNFIKIAPIESRFVINPFDLKDKGILNRELVAEEIIQLLQEIIQDSNVTVLMKTISFPIISTLLKLPYADFKMFADCINPISGVEHLEKLTPLVDEHLKSIWEDLKTDAYDTTKRSIFNRLQSFLNKSLIMNSVCGRDDFSEAMKQVVLDDKNLIISLPIPQMGEDVSEVLGRFFMCRLQIWAKRRQNIAEKDRKPVVLIVDECQNFISEETARTLDQFGRKFGLFMVLAHQHIGQIDGKGLKGSILANCKNKIIGLSDIATMSIMSKAVGVGIDELEALKKGYFYGLFDEQEPIKFYSKLVRFKQSETVINYVKTQNFEFLNGWDLVNIQPTKNTEKNQKFTAKFDL